MAVRTEYQYMAFRTHANDLDYHLNLHGKQGWRLHTCEPVIHEDYYIVVMDKMHMVDDGQDEYSEDEPSPGLAMRG